VAAERAGEKEKAEALFRNCAQVYRHRYYGHLAKSALRRMAKKSGFKPKPLPLPVAGYRKWSRPPGGFIPENRRLKWRAAEMLASMGLHDLAAKEFDRMGSSPYFRYRAALSYSRGERNDMAIRIMHASFWDAVRSGGSDLPQDFWKIAFPLQAKRKRAGEAGPMLVNAIIKAESLFDRLAFSKAGAIGLMQLMPATGRRMAKKLKIRLKTKRRLFNPKLNVRLGSRFLGDLVKEFKGEIVPAIASYNAGKRVVKKWWAARGKEPIESFIERIPYQETRGYVKKVLGYLEEYRRIYGSSGAARAEK
jgi:soluble lytic murein transglycosylase